LSSHAALKTMVLRDLEISRGLAWWPLVVGYAGLAGLLLPYRPVASAAVVGTALTHGLLARFRDAPLREVLLVSTLLVCGMVDWPRSAHFGAITGSGILTIVAAISLSLGWLLAPRNLTKAMPWPVVALVGFVAWVVLSFAYHPPSAAGLQNALVWIAFVATAGTMVVAVRARLAFSTTVMKAIAVSSGMALLLYFGSIARGGLDSHAVIDPRSFALFALIPVGCGLAWYRANHRRLGLVVAAVATLLILLSLSRLAFVAALVLWGIATLNPTTIRGKLRFIAAIALAGVTLYGAVTYIKPLHDRFYRGQIVQVQTGVPGVAQFNVNLEGRLELWTTTWDSYVQSPIIGHGAGAADDLITRTYGSGAGHPHSDYLRLLNDYGVVGFAFWIIGFLLCLKETLRNWVRALRAHDGSELYHLAAFLAFVGVGLGMSTDNVMIYLPVMVPVGALLGVSLVMIPQQLGLPENADALPMLMGE
jgi:O-antigen ligase